MTATRTIQVRLNGKVREIEADRTVRELLETLGLNAHMVVVELNREILSRETLGEVTVAEGDQVEVVHFVGGG